MKKVDIEGALSRDVSYFSCFDCCISLPRIIRDHSARRSLVGWAPAVPVTSPANREPEFSLSLFFFFLLSSIFSVLFAFFRIFSDFFGFFSDFFGFFGFFKVIGALGKRCWTRRSRAASGLRPLSALSVGKAPAVPMGGGGGGGNDRGVPFELWLRRRSARKACVPGVRPSAALRGGGRFAWNDSCAADGSARRVRLDVSLERQPWRGFSSCAIGRVLRPCFTRQRQRESTSGDVPMLEDTSGC